MRTITLELVRHGPAHNQLLSPLTQYLALCENHPAVTLQLPLEHNQMLYRLGALAYRMGPEPREFQLRDTAQLIGELLARIPGLTADMNRRDDRSGNVFAQNVDGDRDRRDDGFEDGSAQSVDGDRATHLRLVLSASELALLPFELAVAPNGFPGAGQPLLLQSVRPVALTRETRRVAEEQVVWPDRTRVLFVVASPPELPPPPAAAHLLALRRTLEPWIGTRSSTAEGVASETGDDRLARHLTVLTDASLEAIEAACSEGNYTHVHILAHGGEYREGYDTRFGLLLHDSADPMGPADRVSGERLATALRTSRKGTSGQLARPAVVTLASCYSAGVGSVTLTGVGASIAHALHADGIPMVIASQFPLSFGGSVRMVEMLYEGLLSGEDPRRLLIDLRRSLHTQFPDMHDWASITAYSSLPPNFDRQLAAVQIERARRSIEVALDLAAEVVAGVERVRRSRQVTANQAGSTAVAVGETEIDSAMKRVRESRARLARLVGRLPSRRIVIVALLASADQHEAALEYETLKRKLGTIAPEELDKRVWPPLERARRHYGEAFGLDATHYWAVQYISLSVVMRHGGRLMQDTDPANGEIGQLWKLAEIQSLRELSSFEYTRRAWALGSLIDLYLLAPVIKEVKEAREHPGPPPDWRALATNKAKELAKMARPGADEIIFSTRRQIVRYLDFYGELCPSLEEAVGIAEQVARLLPAQLPEDVPPS
jgi:hypothetical protein